MHDYSDIPVGRLEDQAVPCKLKGALGFKGNLWIVEV